MDSQQPAKNLPKTLLTVLVLLAIVLVGFFAIRTFLFYQGILSGDIQNLDLSFTEEMSLASQISLVEPDVEAHMVASSDDPFLGAEDPLLTVVEFSDFQCPYCQVVSSTVRRLALLYGDRVKFIYRDYPVAALHDQAQQAAEAAECAHDQDKFWEYHDKLFANQDDLSLPALRGYALELGLDVERFGQCLSQGEHRAEVLDDFADGTLAGVYGTPTFFFNGSRVAGAIPEDVFESIIQGFLE